MRSQATRALLAIALNCTLGAPLCRAEGNSAAVDATAVDSVRVTHTFTALESAVQRNGKLTIVTITSWPHLINRYKAVAVDASAKTFYTILCGSGSSPATIEREENLTLLYGKRASQFTGTRDIQLIAKASSALQRKLGEIKPYLAPSNGHGQLTVVSVTLNPTSGGWHVNAHGGNGEYIISFDPVGKTFTVMPASRMATNATDTE